jgi:hypothetical protein
MRHRERYENITKDNTDCWPSRVCGSGAISATVFPERLWLENTVTMLLVFIAVWGVLGW